MSTPSKRKTRASAAAESTAGAADALAPLVDAVNAPEPSGAHETDNGTIAVYDREVDSWLSKLAGRPFSWRRTITAYVLAFVTATVTRQLCFSTPVFGSNLGKSLAPIERSDVEWSIVALVRAIDLVLAMSIWYTSGRAVDPPVLGALLTMVSRPPLYLFVHRHFLLSSTTAYQILTTDLVSYGAAAFVISQLQPRKPTFRRQPITFLKSLSADALTSTVLAFILGTLVSALIMFLFDRLGLKAVVRRGVMERTVPAIHTPSNWGFSFVIRHPNVVVPIIRSDLEDLTMAKALKHSLPLAGSLVLLTLFVLPQAPISTLVVLAYALTAPQTVLYLNNVLPFRFPASLLVGIETGLRAAAVAAATAWTLYDVRQPTTKKVFVLRQEVDVPALQDPGQSALGDSDKSL